jgi:hypothetical protein
MASGMGSDQWLSLSHTTTPKSSNDPKKIYIPHYYKIIVVINDNTVLDEPHSYFGGEHAGIIFFDSNNVSIFDPAGTFDGKLEERKIEGVEKRDRREEIRSRNGREERIVIEDGVEKVYIDGGEERIFTASGEDVEKLRWNYLNYQRNDGEDVYLITYFMGKDDFDAIYTGAEDAYEKSGGDSIFSALRCAESVSYALSRVAKFKFLEEKGLSSSTTRPGRLLKELRENTDGIPVIMDEYLIMELDRLRAKNHAPALPPN